MLKSKNPREHNLNHHQMEWWEWALIGFVLCSEGHCEVLKSLTNQVEEIMRDLGLYAPDWNQCRKICERYSIPKLYNDATNEQLGRSFTEIIGRLEDMK